MPVTTRRRPISLLLALAILATALAPLLGALREAAAGEGMPLCHQAGMQVDAASAPIPAGPGEPARKTHCPLCIMVFFASFAEKPQVRPALVTGALVVAAERIAEVRHLLTTASFRSRAPPTSA